MYHVYKTAEKISLLYLQCRLRKVITKPDDGGKWFEYFVNLSSQNATDVLKCTWKFEFGLVVHLSCC